ncbi:Ubiquitin fusion degradation protein 4 [Physocladia obscura]|uniref:HECT-type E3 ubiquitin transferase n=1 Tax=Physocladia obscura TaxID=109957 RepID=A0AAD5XKB2_9FUNG|nr:Ubiquitin fusion degradation protein 4 [Physocladia obscura]
MGRKSRSSLRKSISTKSDNDDDVISESDPMQLDVNRIASPGSKKTKLKKPLPPPKQNNGNDDDEMIETNKEHRHSNNEEEEEADLNEHDEDNMTKFMNAIMNAQSQSAESGATQSEARSALFHAMFGGPPPRQLSSAAPEATSSTATTATTTIQSSGKFGPILRNLSSKDLELQSLALQELAEILSMATEDMFAGYSAQSAHISGFHTREFTAALVSLLSPNISDDLDPFLMDDYGSGGGGFMASEVMVLACRCLANLVEANPHAASIVVQCGGVKALVGKLREIEYIELAEQVLAVLDKICVDYASAIIKEDGLIACIHYLDFFSLHVQRTAVSIVSKSCKTGLPSVQRTCDPSTVSKLSEILPILKPLLSSTADAKMTANAISAIESIVFWCRYDEKTLTSLANPLIPAIMALVRPAAESASAQFSISASFHGSSNVITHSVPVVSSSLFTQLLRILVVICKGSAELHARMLYNDCGVTDAVCAYLTSGDTQGGGMVGAPTDQVVQILVLAGELFSGFESPESAAEWTMHPRKIETSTENDVANPVEELPARRKQKASAAAKKAAPPSSRTLRSSTSSTSLSGTAASITTKLEPVAATVSTNNPAVISSPNRRNHILPHSTKPLLETYASRILPITMQVFSTSVHPQIRRLSVECTAKAINVCENAPNVGKFVQELLLARHNGGDALFFAGTGVIISKVVVSREQIKNSSNTVVVGELVREGVLSEVRKCVEELESEVSVAKKVNAVESQDTKKHDDENENVGKKGEGDEKDNSSPVGGLLEGMKNVFERMTGVVSSSSSSMSAVGTSSSPTVPVVQHITGLNGEKYTDGEVREWLLQAATAFLKQVSETSNNKPMISTSLSASFDVLSDLKKLGKLLSGAAISQKSSVSTPLVKVAAVSTPASKNDILGLMLSELHRVATHFAGLSHSNSIYPVCGVTGFEVLESGIIDGLLAYLTHPSGTNTTIVSDTHSKLTGTFTAPLLLRQQAFLHVFMDGPLLAHTGSSNLYTPNALRNCVSRLQECLSRSEAFAIIVAIPTLANWSSSSGHESLLSLFGGGFSNSSGGGGAATVREQSNPAIQLARQVRLKLVADGDGDGVPASLRSFVVSVHAVATFKSFEDFLKTRVGASLSSRGDDDKNNADENCDEDNGVHDDDDDDDDDEDDDDDDNDDDDNDDDDREELVDLQELLESARGISTSSSPIVTPVAVIPPPSSPHKSRSSSPTRPKSPTKSTTSVSKSIASASSASVTPLSYAGAASNNGIAIKFTLGDEEIPTESTVFGALYRHEMDLTKKSSLPNIWNKTYTIKFKKVAVVTPAKIKHVSPKPPDLTEPDSAAHKIMLLLRVLYLLNTNWQEVYEEFSLAKLAAPMPGVATAADGHNQQHQQQQQQHPLAILSPLPATFFINNKITHKLNRQLAEPLIVASSVLPTWSNTVARDFSFLVPFETRLAYVQSTAFGYARSVARWTNNTLDLTNNSAVAHSRSLASMRDSLTDAAAAAIGRIPRQKVRIARARLVDSMMKVMDLYGGTNSLIEVEFFDEVGTGLGPTLEFYSSVCHEMRRSSGVAVSKPVKGGTASSAAATVTGDTVTVWRNGNGVSGDYLNPREGLFPAPLDPTTSATVVAFFGAMGTFVAKALLDSRIVDMPFSSIFLEMVVWGRHWDLEDITTIDNVGASLNVIKHVDGNLHASLSDIFKFAQLASAIESNKELTAQEKKDSLATITVKGARLEELCLDFTLPGYPSIELQVNGENTPITLENVSTYVARVIEATIGNGVQTQVDAFRAGFCKVFDIAVLKCFSVQELSLLMGGSSENEDWTYLTIMDAIKADHGYTRESQPIQCLAEMMESFTAVERREFLMFVTGSPKLPIGGFKALNPRLTVVRKSADIVGTNMDEYLPSVMTCVNYLKVPAYSSKDVMRERFEVAMKEGQGSFHLS